jgi:hypothetical protein
MNLPRLLEVLKHTHPRREGQPPHFGVGAAMHDLDRMLATMPTRLKEIRLIETRGHARRWHTSAGSGSARKGRLSTPQEVAAPLIKPTICQILIETQLTAGPRVIMHGDIVTTLKGADVKLSKGGAFRSGRP